MGRRRRSGMQEFWDGFNQSYDSVGRVVQDYQLNEAAKEKPEESTGFTEAQGEQLRQAADSGQYDVSFNQTTGQYEVTPKAGGATGQFAPVTKTTMFGKTVEGKMSERDVDRARLQAMAGVYDRTGNPQKAMQLRQQARQGELQDLQLSDAQRKDESARKLKEADDQVAKWMKTRIRTDADGNPQPLTDDDFIMAGKQRVFALADRGLYAEAAATGREAMDYATRKVQAETVERQAGVRDAVAKVMRGDHSAALDVYNRFVPDGSKATAVKKNADGSYTVERESAVDGSKLPAGKFKDLDAMVTSLQSLADPNAVTSYLQRTFQHDIETRRLGMQGANLALAQKEEQRKSERWGIEKSVLEAQKEDSENVRQARRGLMTAIESGDEKKIEQAKAKAVAAGIKFDKPNNEFVSTTDSMGLNVTRTNKDTGQVDIINPKTGQVTTIPGPGAKPAAAQASAGIPTPDKREVGKSYDTPRGKMIWRGTGWEPVSK